MINTPLDKQDAIRRGITDPDCAGDQSDHCDPASSNEDEILFQILDGIAVPAFVINRNHTVAYWNRACENLTGLTSSNIIGTTDHWKVYYESEHPTIADLILNNNIEDVIGTYYGTTWRRSQSIEGGYEAECFFPNTGERGRWLYVTASPIKSRSGSIIGAVETIQDITQLRFVENDLRHNLKELVKERTKDLLKTNEKLHDEIIERKKIEQELRRLTVTDHLTQINNRKMFIETLDREIKRFDRYQTNLSIIMFDIDNFKSINDTWGHDVGDDVLVKIADIVRGSIREINTFARWGGEEFLILLPDTALSEASALAERLRIIIAQAPILESLPVTCSFGVTQFTSQDDEKSFLKNVDTALYQAKDGGRNMVVSTA
jgi:diguanylate cyclase (GGDEF)-like protein